MSNLSFHPFWRWPGSLLHPEHPPGFGVGSIDVGLVGVPGLQDWRPPATGAGLSMLDDTSSSTESAPWSWPSTGPGALLEDTSQPYLPWLRAPTDVPGFRLSPDGSVKTGETAGGVRLMAGAFPPTAPQEQPSNVAGINGLASRDVGLMAGALAPILSADGSVQTGERAGGVRLMAGAFPSAEPQGQSNNVAGINGLASRDVGLMAGALAPIEPQEDPNEIAGSDRAASSDGAASPQPGVMPSAISAASIAVPASPSAPIDLAALARRFAPVVAAAGPAAAAALPFLLIPTNRQSETTDLGDGLRARVRPGQRSVEVERRVDSGLFGTGIMAKWETLPVEAWQQVGRDGSVNTVINHEQLNQALGRSAPMEPVDSAVSAMARPPRDSDPLRPPPAADGSAADQAGKSDPRNPPVPLTGTRIDAKVLEEARRRDPEEERVLACRAVRQMPEVPAPRGHYSGVDAIDTAVGIRVAPGFPAPKAGYDYNPDHVRHRNGYRGELELKNRIENAIPYEKIVHYGNPAGDHGPDVFTIGPDGLPMEWDSKSRIVSLFVV